MPPCTTAATTASIAHHSLRLAGRRAGFRYDDGTSEGMMMRERPHLVFAPDGVTPVALVTGAAPGPFSSTGRGGRNDYSFTLLQKLNQKPNLLGAEPEAKAR